MDVNNTLPSNRVPAYAARENTEPGEQQVGEQQQIRHSDQPLGIGQQQALLPGGVYDSVNQVALIDRKAECFATPSFISTVHKLIKSPGCTFRSAQRGQLGVFSVSYVDGQQLQIRDASQLSGMGQQQDLLAEGVRTPVALAERKIELSAATSLILTAHKAIKTSCYSLLSVAAVSFLHRALGLLLDQPIADELHYNPTIKILVIGACKEELIFRGCIQYLSERLLTLNGLSPDRAKQLSLAGSSLLFALAHAGNSGRFQWASVTPRIPAGYFLGEIFQEEGLLASSAVHVLHNIIVTKLLPMSAAGGSKAVVGTMLLMTYFAIGTAISLEVCPEEIAPPNSDDRHSQPSEF